MSEAAVDDFLDLPEPEWTVVILWMRPTEDGEHAEPFFVTMTVQADNRRVAGMAAFAHTAQKYGALEEDLCVGPAFRGRVRPEGEDESPGEEQPLVMH